MNNHQLAHAWANQTTDSARGSNFYFEGASIYSYGKHFEIARIHRQAGDFKNRGRSNMDRHKRGIILFTSRSYSNTTARHKSYTVNAIDFGNYDVFFVPRVEGAPYHEENLAHLVDRVKDARQIALTSLVSIIFKADQVRARIDQTKEYMKAFKVSGALKVSTLKELKALAWTKKEYAKILSRADREKDKERAREAQQAKLAEKRLQDAQPYMVVWRMSGEWSVYAPCSLQNLPVMLRESADGARIITSHGAEVNADGARRLYLALKMGESLLPNMDIDGFPIHGVKDSVLKIGCHNIPMAEVELLAQRLNW